MKESLIPFDDARSRLLADVHPVSEMEEVDTQSALGRVLAVSQFSRIDMPPADNAAMDGYAVRSAEVMTAGTILPVSQRVPAGSVPHPLAAHSAARIFTGAMLPPGADTVVRQEVCERVGDAVRINVVPLMAESVRHKGENLTAGTEVLTRGTRLRPQEIALAASVGLATLPVFRRVRVAVFSTGSELVMPGEPLPQGGIYNSNRFLLRSLLESLGCDVIDFGIVRDDLAATRTILLEAARSSDLVLTSGGVSVGEEDHVKPAMQAEGRLDVWRVAMKPGKAFAFGRVGSAAFIGLPGNPVSSFVTFVLLVRPFLLASQGAQTVLPQGLYLPAAFERAKPSARREFMRARIAESGVMLFPDQGSAALQSTAWAEGLVDIPADETIEKGQPVRFLPISDLLH